MSNDRLGFNRALVLCPHMDDGELWCGGTMIRLIEENCDLHYVSFSSPKDERGNTDKYAIDEVNAATKMIGINDNNIIHYDNEARMFHTKRQKILDEMVLLNNLIRPDVVFAPSIRDIHQDHVVIAEEALRAFRQSTILAYDTIRNSLSFSEALFVSLSERQMNKKAMAIAQYKSQHFRQYFTSDFIMSLARVRGTQIDVPFAEAFEVIKWIIR